MAQALHVALGCGRAGVEVLYDELLDQIRAPFEETSSHGFQQSGYFGIAQRLMCKFDSIHLQCTKCVNDMMLIPGWMSGVSLVGCGAQPIQGPGCGKLGTILVTELGVVHILPFGIGSVHRSTDRSFKTEKIAFLL
jgi:hypothetical protein